MLLKMSTLAERRIVVLGTIPPIKCPYPDIIAVLPTDKSEVGMFILPTFSSNSRSVSSLSSEISFSKLDSL